MAKKTTARLHCVACHLPRNGVIAVIATLIAKMRSAGQPMAHSLTTFVQGVTLNCGSLKVMKNYIQPKKSLRRKAAEQSVHWTGATAPARRVFPAMMLVMAGDVTGVNAPASNASR